ncbi:Sec23 domain-containing protein [Tubulinosema ratisbonensis]|uniref:Sec23 domain-containing protein n=1 Tax=Tubulinosema ratisbonensis TaxID=291195 RepID=A0A437AQ75_9MICR|nr:Sec23 domain-containing protein [Tubulinosema ratisbonensis]
MTEFTKNMPKEQKSKETPFSLKPPHFSSEEKTNKIMVPVFNTEIKKNISFSYYDTSVGMPPFCTTNFHVTETLNTDPHMVRSTMYYIPKENYYLDSLGAPLSLIITPFNNKSFFNEILDEPVQCTQCLGYFNSYSNLFEPLKGFKCNLCGNFNKASKDYNFVTAEYKLKERKGYLKKKNIVNEEYFNQEEYLPPVFVFCIEVSKITVNTNYYSQILDSIEKVLEERNFENVSFLIFTSEISILKIKNGIIYEERISDLNDLPFCSPDILFDLEDKSKLFDYLRNNVKPKNSIASVKPLIKYLSQLGNFFVGSKVALFTSNSKENEETGMIKDVLISNRVNINLFTIGQNDYLERIVHFSNGKISKFVNSTDDLYIQLYNLWSEKSVYGVSLQIKTSDQIGKKEIFGSGDTEGTSISLFSHMDTKSTVCASFFIDEDINQDKVYFQIILNYYKEDSKKYVLVCNLGLPVTSDTSLIFNNLCFDSIFCIFVKSVLGDFENFKSKIKNVDETLIKIYSYYRQKCAKDPLPTHLHIPESLKLLPLLVQSMKKSALFNTDQKFGSFQNLISASVLKTLRYFYPRLISFSDYFTTKNLDSTELLSLSFSVIQQSEVYILDNSEKIYVYFGKEVLDELKSEIMEGNLEENKVFVQLVEEIQSEYFYASPVIFIEENSFYENEFFSYFIEDDLHGQLSYENFIRDLHFNVRKKD